jgi:hypothetical protein
LAYATKLQIKRREIGPIDVEVHVKPELVALGVKDEIWFFADAELDPEIIRGPIEHWEWSSPDGEVHRAADITYSARMENEWQRLVCCKEMLHILDPVGLQAGRC